MAEIQDPWHSRPLDVHRWSEHPEIKGLVDMIWERALPEEVVGPGPKPKTSFRKQLRVLILDLYVAWLDDPDLSIGVHMSVNAWNTNSRYNALHLSKKMVPIINALHEVKLIDMAKGSYGGAGAKGNRITRIRASKNLQGLFAKTKLERSDIGRAEGEEVIILKDKKNKQIEYKDTPETNQLRDDLRAYNDLIACSFIDIPSLQEPIIEIGTEGEVRRIGLDSTRTHRVFSRSSWDKHGRFYGGWWQQIDSDWRSRITIDAAPTIEADYQGFHVAMLYAEAGVELAHDPYDLPDHEIQGFSKEENRKLAKRLVLTAINAKEKPSAYGAFRDGFPKGDVGRKMTNNQLDGLLEAVLTRNPCLRDRLFTDQGIRLMNKDSQITALIHNHFTKKGIPVLSVHDSYIVDCGLVGELRQVMAEASEEVVGRPLMSSLNIPGREEFAPVDEQALTKYIHDVKWAVYESEETACEGYVQRLLAYEARTGRSISPYDHEPE